MDQLLAAGPLADGEVGVAKEGTPSGSLGGEGHRPGDDSAEDVRDRDGADASSGLGQGEASPEAKKGPAPVWEVSQEDSVEEGIDVCHIINLGAWPHGGLKEALEVLIAPTRDARGRTFKGSGYRPPVFLLNLHD